MGNQQTYKPASLHSAWRSRCSASNEKFRIACGVGLETLLPTGCHGACCKKVFECKVWRRDTCLNSLAFLTKSLVIRVHKTDNMVGTPDKRAIRARGVGLTSTTFFYGVQSREELGDRLNKVKAFFQELGVVISVEKEVRPARSVEYIGFVWDAQAKMVSVPQNTRRREYRRGNQEFTQARTIEDDVAAPDWKAGFSARRRSVRRCGTSAVCCM